MKFINRCVVTLRPKPAFIEWIKSIDVEIPEIWDFEGGAYLFDEQETDESLLAELEKKAEEILENEFSVWTEDSSQWPVSRDFAYLKQHFTFHIAIAAFDLGREQLLRADVAGLL
ncbi:hypothetical protein [uncultured Endozoicomonas sp.]|uniref:hypothetical protein n=1 Tax=uncultured Endozoicomonas sp. TaxID=432652 RepID=UPI00263708E6|nr:hypothetical protein [uncultured Endozoicomonas sp.]